MPRPHASWPGISSAPETLPLPGLGLDLTVSILSWRMSTLACPDSGSPSSDSDTNSILVTYSMFTISGLLSRFTNSLLSTTGGFVWKFSSCLASALSWPSLALC